MTKPRLLVFDILRIAAIVGIVALHIHKQIDYAGWFPNFPWVSLIVFISGAVLAYTYPNIENIKDYTKFMLKRLERIYPVYWLSITFSLMLIPYTILIAAKYPLQTIFAFYSPINSISWFIVLIVILYAIYPALSKFLKKYSIIGLMSILIISLFFNFLLAGNEGWANGYYSPLVRCFEFALGIFIVQHELYPKWELKSIAVKFASDLTFPIFIIHMVIIGYLWEYGLITYLIILLTTSCILYFIDSWIQRKAAAFFLYKFTTTTL